MDIASQNAIDILQNCYVDSKPIETIDRDLQIIIKDQIPRFACDAKQIYSSSISPGGNIGNELRSQVLSKPANGSLVVLMGGIGSGKSTFCKRFFRVVAPDLINPRGSAILVYLDFLGAPHQPNQLKEYFWSKLSESLIEGDRQLVDRSQLGRAHK